MLYRLIPPTTLQWSDFPAGTQMFNTAVEHGADFDRLEWQPTEARVFSADMLRVALRHGVVSNIGIILSAMHTVALGRADELRLGQQQIDELGTQIRQQNGPLMEALIPGWTESGEELDERVRQSTERSARVAEGDLAKVLAAPVDPALADHWQRLGGVLPD